MHNIVDRFPIIAWLLYESMVNVRYRMDSIYQNIGRRWVVSATDTDLHEDYLYLLSLVYKYL